MKTAAHIPIDDQNMRGHIKDRQRGWASAARELKRTAEAMPLPIPPGGKRYVTAEEACADLGLEPEVRKVVEAEIRGMVSEQKSGFEVSKELRKQKVKAPVIRELLARGMRMVSELRAQRTVSDLFVRKAKPPPGAGWQPIPKGKSGGYRRPKSGGGFEYAYPDADGGYTSHAAPAADESLDVHEEHENGTPDPKVQARMVQMQEKAKAAGLDFTGVATSRTTMKHLNELEKQLDRAIAQKQKRAAGKKGKKKLADDDVFATPSPEKKPAEPEAKPAAEPAAEPEAEAPPEPKVEPPPEARTDDGAEKAVRELAAAKGIAQETLDKVLADPDFQTEEGRKALTEHMKGLPDVGPTADLPDEPPAKPEERKKLEENADSLEDVVRRLEKALAVEREKHAEELKALREEIKKLKARPTPRNTVETTHQVWAFALITLGAVVGGLFAGPMGAMLGSSMANQYIRTGVFKGQRRPPGIYLAGDEVVLIKSDDHHARVELENQPEAVARHRATIVQELRDVTAAPENPAEVVQVLEDQSATWRAVARWLSPENRRKLIVAAAGILHAKAPVKPVEKDPSSGSRPFQESELRRLAHGESPRRDGLTPGETLVSKSANVQVLPGGGFRMGDNEYPDGRTLLKALGAPGRMTVRQFFRLRAEDARMAKSAASALRERHPTLLIAPLGGWVRVEGDLSRYNIPAAHPLDTVAILDPSDVEALLETT